METSKVHFEKGLLPIPRETRLGPGDCAISASSRLHVKNTGQRVERAFQRWLAHMPPGESGGQINVTVTPNVTPHRDGYRLTTTPEGIELLGASPAGCFHGLQTLRRLSGVDRPGTDRTPASDEVGRPRGLKPAARSTLTRITPDACASGSTPSSLRPGISSIPGVLPCGVMVDWPDFDTRGLLHDVTRGKVPTLDTLKGLVDRLVLLKINQLQLYLEHAFVFSFDPDICGPQDGLTAGEIQELDLYCRDRFVNLVPAVATFGHMGRILSMPRYRHLAEVEPSRNWSEMDWPQRARGLTLDCVNPEAQQLVERIWSDILEAFSSPIVNICGDEPWDLGAGKNRQAAALVGKGKLYVEHLRRTHDLLSRRGRRTQFWSDVILRHVDQLDHTLCDSTVLHWGYDDSAGYDATEILAGAGMDTIVCPGTSGWKRILNGMNAAERNMVAFATAGRKYGATGLLNTDWGDHGHFNALACSWHGVTLGASLAWRVNHPTGSTFDALFTQVELGIDSLDVTASLRAAARLADTCETWRLFWMPIEAIASDPSLPDPEQVDQFRDASDETARCLTKVPADRFADARDREELLTACRFGRLLANKLAVATTMQDQEGRTNRAPTGRAAADRWVTELHEMGDAYATCWRQRNKTSGLNDIMKALTASADDYRSAVS